MICASGWSAPGCPRTSGPAGSGCADRLVAQPARRLARFDPAAPQPRLDGLRQLRAQVDRQTVHVVVAKGRGPDPLPLLLTHGWPGSFLEYLELLPLLSEPGRARREPVRRIHRDRSVAARIRIQRLRHQAPDGRAPGRARCGTR